MAKRRGDGDRDEPTLELPSLFGRKKRRRDQDATPGPDAAPAGPAEPETAYGEADQDPIRASAPAPEPAPEPELAAPPESEPAPEPAPEPMAEPASELEPETRRKAPRAARTKPALPAAAAAILTGLVVGLMGTGLTALSLRGCEEVRGTSTCGGPGLGLLVVIVAVMVVAGALLLKLLGVAEHRGTSFLAIGLTCVVVLVTLMEDLFSVWMFVAVPLICAASYLLAQWVTTRFVEIDDADEPHVDVR